VLRLIAVSLRLEGRIVLDNATMEARAGELLVIEGVRAGGKTKLLEIAAARRRSDSGQVWIANHDVSALQRDSLPFVRRNIGFVPEFPRFLPGLNVLDNVMLPLGARAEPIGWAREAALRALGKVGVVGLATGDPARLSASARRLVGIARALAGSPPLVLLDDPSASLAVADTGAVLSALLGAVQSGAAVVCASADVSFVAAAVRAGARRLRIEAGRILAGAGAITVIAGGRAVDRQPRREVAP
jgi:ABC-type ATPase involved in cell division